VNSLGASAYLRTDSRITDVVFGWYGVLVDRQPRLALAGQYPSGVIDMVLDPADLWGFDYYDAMLACGWDEERVLADYERHHGPAVAWVLRVYLERRRLALCAMVTDMGAALRDLRAQGIRVWTLANAAAVDCDLAREVFPELGLLSGSVISAREGLLMPDPALISRANRRFGQLGFVPGSVLFVDANARSIEIAQRAGWRGMLFQNAEQLRSELANV
jgi:2-haloacid dehalogenase